jgi:hypothetical protein
MNGQLESIGEQALQHLQHPIRGHTGNGVRTVDLGDDIEARGFGPARRVDDLRSPYIRSPV